jgi:hypothetical protein
VRRAAPASDWRRLVCRKDFALSIDTSLGSSGGPTIDIEGLPKDGPFEIEKIVFSPNTTRGNITRFATWYYDTTGFRLDWTCCHFSTTLGRHVFGENGKIVRQVRAGPIRRILRWVFGPIEAFTLPGLLIGLALTAFAGWCAAWFTYAACDIVLQLIDGVGLPRLW